VCSSRSLPSALLVTTLLFHIKLYKASLKLLFVIIGVVGSIASGKGTVAKEFEKKGFVKLVFSDYLREELTRRGVEITRSNLQDLANDLREKHGSDFLAQRLIEKIEPGKNYVLDGVRNPEEIKALRGKGETIIIAVKAPLNTRLQWIMMRGKENDPHTIEEILAIEAKDNGLGQPEHGLHVSKCLEMADFTIQNDKTREHLKKNIDKLLKKLKIT
jgi:dephospho-CoA kinase